MTLAQLMTLVILIWNGMVFVAYGLDKGRARQGGYRIPEKTLLLMSFLLGGLGALFGANFFHHKTRKWYFHLVWWCGIVVTALLLYWIWRPV